MLFSETSRVGLLDRVGAEGISEHPVSISVDYLNNEKQKMLNWLSDVLK